MAELDHRLASAIAGFPPPVLLVLLRILDLPDEARAHEIGSIHRAGTVPQLAELLIDLEEDSRIRGIVRSELRNQARA